MPTDIVIPQLGESITEAVIASWLVEDGAYVERDEEIVELETDKVTMPLPAPGAGVIARGADEGDTVEVGANIGSIDESAEKPSGDDDDTKQKKGDDKQGEKKQAQQKSDDTGEDTDKDKKDDKQKSEQKQQASPPPPSAPEPQPSTATGSGGAVTATPVARKLASERGLDLASVHGTGPGGKVREQDVLAALHSAPTNGSASHGASSSNGAAASSREVTRTRMTQLRKSVAARLVEAQQTAAMLTTFNECEMTNVMALRSKHKDAFLEAHGVKLGFMSFFVKAVCSALKAHPQVNAFIVDGDKGPEIEEHAYCDVAIAVGTPKGLVVPVLRNAESMSFDGVESGINALAKKARDGQLTLEEMQGGTFTITNGGIYGSMMSTPILNPPQSGILGMHNIIKRPIEHPDKPGEIALRPMMYLALSYDHRIVDGEGAVTFLRHVKDCIEAPERLMLGV